MCVLSKPKDPIPKEDRNNAIYQLNCKDCEAVYVGETKRTLNIRAEEHITAIKSASKKSHTAEHCWKYNHDFDWKHKKVLDFEKNWKTRTIKESIYSEENQNYKNKTPLIATGIDPKFNTPIKIMSELRQYHSNLRVFQIKQTKNGWIFIGDTPKDFAILQSETKMQQVFGPKVKMSLPKSYHSADAKKDKILVFKGVSNKISLEDFKLVLDFNKITHAEAERMKSKRTGRDLPFIKVKCDNPKQAEELISGGLICQKTGIIFKVEEFRITPSIQQCFKCQGFGHKAQNCTKKQKCVVCGEAHSHKDCPNKNKKTPKCANCRGPHVANYRGCPAYKDQAFR